MEEVMIDKLVDLYNSKESKITPKDKADLKEVIFTLSEELEKKVPLIPEYKYIEIITKDPSVFNVMMRLSYGPSNNIPVRFFEQYLKDKSFYANKLNNANIIGFTDDPGNPYIIAYVYPYKGRLYVDWGENIPMELERRYQGKDGYQRIKEVYGDINIRQNDEFKDFTKYENEVQEQLLI